MIPGTLGVTADAGTAHDKTKTTEVKSAETKRASCPFRNRSPLRLLLCFRAATLTMFDRDVVPLVQPLGDQLMVAGLGVAFDAQTAPRFRCTTAPPRSARAPFPSGRRCVSGRTWRR